MKRMMSLILTLLLFSTCALAEAPGAVTFSDPVLEMMIREQMGKPEGDITAAEAETVIDLFMNREAEGDPAIRDISSLAPFVNLSHLSLIGHEIADIGVLENILNLKMLDLGGNRVTDLSPLSKLPLEVLAVWANGITDISALAPIETLNNLMLNDNRITDFSPIQNLTNLQYLYVRCNATEDYSPLEAIFPGLKECDFEVLTTPFDKAEVIRFGDPVLEQKVRDTLNIHDRDVTAGDAAVLRDLNADTDQNAPEESRVHDISALKYFVNLETLSLNNSAVADISALAGLEKLKALWISGEPPLSLEPLAGLTRMVWLGINGGMKDAEFVANMPDLESLRIDGLRNLPAGLPALHKLREFVSNGGELSDISLLAQIPTLEAVDLSWNMVTDLTPLAGLPLKELYLQGNLIEDYSPIKEIYPNLLGRNFEYIEITQPENPDAVITFPDPVMEMKVRRAMNIPEGDITAGEAAKITRLDIQNQWQPQIPQEVLVRDLTGIEAFINLRELIASFNAISDISPLSGLSELTNLELGSNAVNDISPLAGLNRLVSLTLFGNGIRDFNPLSSLTHLHSLHIGGLPFYDFAPLAGLTNIDHLYADGCGVEDISPLAGMTNMYKLYLSGNYITDLAPLAGMTNLVLLNLANNPIRDYSPIEKLYPQLQEKDFEYGQVFDVVVPLMPEKPEEPVVISDAALEGVLREATGIFDRPLTQMDLSRIGKIAGSTDGMWGQVSDITALKHCLNLDGLFIIGSRVSDLTPLAGLSKLRVLSIFDSAVEEVTPLGGLQQLAVLELKGNRITDVSPLKNLTRLERLDLVNNQIMDFSPLFGLDRLSALFIGNNPAGDTSGFEGIFGSLMEKDFEPGMPAEPLAQPKDPGKTIKIPDKVMEKKVREAIGKPEGKITAGDAAMVEELYLGNEYQEKFPKGSQIADLSGIEHFINLKRLDISWNKIKDIKKLSGLTRLEYLKAFGNQITSVTPLKDLVNLNSLNIGGNKLTKIDALAGLFNLTELYLNDNKLTNISALADLKDLTLLNLNNNKIKDYSPISGIYPQLLEKDFEMK